MRILRIIITVVFILTSTVFLWFYIDEKKSLDETYPEITMENEILEVDVKAKKKDFLVDVSAYDGKDGDITDKIVVESVSRFIKSGESIVSYAVCDNDKHVTRTSRKVRFKNYKPPVFTLNGPLIFNVTDKIDVSEKLGAKDMIDGDISDKLIITVDDTNSKTSGNFRLAAQASNSMGDTIYLDLPILVEKESNGGADINLKSYLIYSKVGKDIDFKNYVKEIIDTDGRKINPTVSIKTDFDKNKAGTYSVNYYATNSKGVTSHTILTVILGS